MLKMNDNKKKNVKVLLGLAYINRGEYDAVGDYSKLLEGVNGTDGIDGLYIRNIDDLAAVREHFTDKIFMLSNSLYTYNDMAATELLDILRSHTGKVIFDTSIELTLKEALAIIEEEKMLNYGISYELPPEMQPLDGYSWSFSARLADGRSLSTHGYNAGPGGEGLGKMQELLFRRAWKLLGIDF